MSYLLGSEAEAIHFNADRVEYLPAGKIHAVDAETPTNTAGPVLAYAVCGTAVRVWPEQPFNPGAPEVHDRCAAITGAAASEDSATEP